MSTYSIECCYVIIDTRYYLLYIYIDVSMIRLCQVAGTVTFTQSDAAVSI